MRPTTVIRPPTEAELAGLPELETRSYAMYAAIGMEPVAAAEPSLEGFLSAHRRGQLLIATDDHQVAGFLETEVVDQTLYVAGVCVDPAFARRGIGADLLDAAADLARRGGLERMSLTTFADVPWNGPYYRRLGWRVLPDAKASEGLVEIRERQRREGWDRWPRQIMVKEVTASVSEWSRRS